MPLHCAISARNPNLDRLPPPLPHIHLHHLLPRSRAPHPSPDILRSRNCPNLRLGSDVNLSLCGSNFTICSKNPYNYTHMLYLMDAEQDEALQSLLFEMSKTRYLSHVTGYKPTRDQYFLIRLISSFYKSKLVEFVIFCLLSSSNKSTFLSDVSKNIENLDNLGNYEGSDYKLYIRDEIAIMPFDFIATHAYDYKLGSKWKYLEIDEFNATNVIPHMLGYCIIVNDDQSLVQIIPGKNGGFSILLDAEISTYMPNVKSPYYPNKFKDGVFESQRECYQEAIVAIAEYECNCTPWYYVESSDWLFTCFGRFLGPTAWPASEAAFNLSVRDVLKNEDSTYEYAKKNIAKEQTETSKQPFRTCYLGHVSGYQPIRDQYFLICFCHTWKEINKLTTPGNLGEDLVTPGNQEPPDTSKQPIRTRCLGHVTLGHVTGYQPIRDQYFLKEIRTSYLGHVTGYEPIRDQHSTHLHGHEFLDTIESVLPVSEYHCTGDRSLHNILPIDSISEKGNRSGVTPLVHNLRGNQPIRTRYLGHMTGYWPIRDQYLVFRSVPGLFRGSRGWIKELHFPRKMVQGEEEYFEDSYLQIDREEGRAVQTTAVSIGDQPTEIRNTHLALSKKRVGQTDKHIDNELDDKQTGNETNIQTDKHTDKQADKQTDKQADNQTDKQTDASTQTEQKCPNYHPLTTNRPNQDILVPD
eukprot:sb/3462632/